jgi:hypothetical protein
MMKPYQSKLNKSTQKKGEYKEQNGRTRVQKDKEKPSKRVHQKGTSSSRTPSYHEKHIK